MKFVTLQMKPRVPLVMASADEMRDFTHCHTPKECEVVAKIVDNELRRRGLYRVRFGGPFYCAFEAHIVADLIRCEADLGEIAAQIGVIRGKGNYLG